MEIAGSSGIGQLNKDHWRVLHYLREHFLANGTLPVERNLCPEIGLEQHCIEELFGTDLKRAWRFAGLPNPGEEAKVYMANRSTADNRQRNGMLSRPGALLRSATERYRHSES